MSEIVIGKEFENRLNKISDEFFSMPYENEKYYVYSNEEAFDNGEYFCGDIYLQEQMAKGERHSGFPEDHWAQPINSMLKQDPDIWTDFRERVKFEFAKELGAHSSALLNYYPPGGFVGWHTNWNANAYQVLFTYSATGNSYFRYYDMESSSIITIPEKKGWQCRHYYFGRYDEPEHHCWHSAYSGCDRITLAYKFCNEGKSHVSKDKQARQMRDWAIEEIES